VIGESKSAPLRSRLAALHGDADEAAKLLAESASSFRLDIERLLASPALAEAAPDAARHGLRFGLGRSSGSQRSHGIVAAPAPTA
jgi:hypothetical protein